MSKSPMRVLDDAPGPSPWYLRAGSPRIPGFRWGTVGETAHATAGVSVLFNGDGPVLLLDYYNYVRLVDRERMLVWHQNGDSGRGPTAPVDVRVFRPEDLRPIAGELETICGAMRTEKAPFAASGPPSCEFSIPTTVAGERRLLAFPKELDDIDELLILCCSSGVEETPTGERFNLGLLVARPKDHAYELFPQDWFNAGRLDYGYQWVTRVARDPRTQRIHGEGIRIEPFTLDDSLRNIR